MKTTLKNICFLILISIISASCIEPSGRSKYKGFQQMIKAEKVRSVSEIKNNNVHHVVIPREDSLNFRYNSLLKDIKFVRLETTPKSKINAYDKIIISHNRIIVVDKNLKKEIYIFDLNGHFIEKITAGKDVIDEKALISNFIDATYDFKSEEIVLHDQSKAKLYYFDKNGEFKRQQKEYVYFYEFANIPGGAEYVYLNPLGGNTHLPVLQNSSLYFGKKDTRIEYTATDAIKDMKSKKDFIINTHRSINNSNDQMFYTPDFSNNVYRVTGKPGILKELVVELPNPNVNGKLKNPGDQTIEAFTRLTSSGQYYYFTGNVLCNAQDIYFIPTFRGGMSGYFYSGKKRKIIAGGSLSKSLDGDTVRLSGYQFPITTFRDYFVSVLQPKELSIKYGKASSALSSVTRYLAANDNPVLIFYKLED